MEVIRLGGSKGSVGRLVFAIGLLGTLLAHANCEGTRHLDPKIHCRQSYCQLRLWYGLRCAPPASGPVRRRDGGQRSNRSGIETWVWDGTVWTKLSPATSPSVRGEVSMVYDSARQQVVLFGGEASSNSPLNDTWVWDGTNWTKKNPVTSSTRTWLQRNGVRRNASTGCDLWRPGQWRDP